MDRSESRRVVWLVACVPLVASGWSAATVKADIDPLSGIDFVTVGAVGNAPWYGDGGPADNRVYGHGGVNYEYRIGKYEVTSAQWVEFFNAAFDRPVNDRIPHLIPPDMWGGVPIPPNTPGGMRWTTTAQSAMLPTGNIDWRMAAIYCNWLTNNKATTREAFLSGAYDVSTFGYNGNILTDQFEHTPGAAYWIPTWDEHLKASHYDPNKVNADGSMGGWWRYNNGTDTPLVYGPPGAIIDGQLAQANAGFFGGAFDIPLGAYPNVQSPWGLLDLAGGTSEWTEGMWTSNIGVRYRIIEGTHWAQSISPFGSQDNLGTTGYEYPSFSFSDYGFRIASSVPSPGALHLFVPVTFLFAHRRRQS